MSKSSIETRSRATGGVRATIGGSWAVLALLSLATAAMVMLAGLSLAQVPDPSPPTCVSCPAGYHCAHNPERCVPD